jgi:exodeoxyribonuclease VII small subunit
MAEPQEYDSLSNLESLSFEEGFRRLEEMVEALENGGLPLAQASSLYEQGMALVQRCNQLLNEAELKITQLKDSYTVPPTNNGLDWDEELES